MRIEWNGGENPVKPGQTLKAAWLRNGTTLYGPDNGSLLRWSHEGNGGDIIAYEVIGAPEPEPSAETLRDRVAMAALTGLLASPVEKWAGFPSQCVAEAFVVADAFMAARGDA